MFYHFFFGFVRPETTVHQNAATVTYTYNERQEVISEAFSGLFSKQISRSYHPKQIGLVKTVALNPASEYSVEYWYDDKVLSNLPRGRMNRIAGTGLPAGTTGANYGVWYQYAANSDLVSTITYKNAANQPLLQTTRAHEPARDLLTSVTNAWTPTSGTISKYTYTNDDLARRTSVLMEGTAFTDAGGAGVHWNRNDYNTRNELIDAEQYTGSTVQTDFTTVPTDPPVNAGFSEYDYDPIGNRKRMRVQNSPELETAYNVIKLNQYSSSTLHYSSGGTTIVASNQYYYDYDGNLENVELSGDANCDGTISPSDIAAFVMATSDPAAYATNFPYCPLSNSDTNGNGVVNVADIGHFVAMLSNGNGGSAATTYAWDAENRLILVEPTYPTNDAKRTHHVYDHRGRRIRTWTETYYCGDPCTSGTWLIKGTDTDVRYVWDGWLLLEEIDGESSVLRKYTWGLDLAGLNGSFNNRTAAGGIGGLLAMEDFDPATTHTGQFWYSNDANGNVSQAVSPSGPVAARYEYDAYGKRLNAPQTGDLEQPFRFSTKQWSDASGLSYYGYRDYAIQINRWISREVAHKARCLGLIICTGIACSRDQQSPPKEGPAFLDWVSHDWGYGWRRERLVLRDTSGTWVFDDQRLNLILVIIGGPEGPNPPAMYSTMSETGIFTECVVRIGRKRDLMIIVDYCHAEQNACALHPGEALKIYEELTGLNQNYVEALKKVFPAEHPCHDWLVSSPPASTSSPAKQTP